jgi:hypothetical protein
MGILSKLFSGKKAYPPLPDDNELRAQLDELKAPLEDLAHRVSDHIEVVPAKDEAFVFLGKPPKKFGIAWIHEGKVSGLKELVDDHKLSQSATADMVDRLGQAYVKADENSRFTADVGGKQAVVIASNDLEKEVRQIIESTIH